MRTASSFLRPKRFCEFGGFSNQCLSLGKKLAWSKMSGSVPSERQMKQISRKRLVRAARECFNLEKRQLH